MRLHLLVPGGGPFVPGDPILPGTDVGTIQLRFTSQGDIEGSATSTDSTQKVPIPIHVQLASNANLRPGLYL